MEKISSKCTGTMCFSEQTKRGAAERGLTGLTGRINWKKSHWKKFRQNAHVHCAFQSKRSAGQLSAAAACARQARMTFYLKARNFNGKSFKLTFVSFVQSVFVQKNVI